MDVCCINICCIPYMWEWQNKPWITIRIGRNSSCRTWQAVQRLALLCDCKGQLWLYHLWNVYWYGLCKHWICSLCREGRPEKVGERRKQFHAVVLYSNSWESCVVRMEAKKACLPISNVIHFNSVCIQSPCNPVPSYTVHVSYSSSH